MIARLGMASRMRWWMLCVAAGVVAFGLGAARASATPAVLAFPGMAPAATEFDQPEAFLGMGPVKVTIHGTVYLLQVSAERDLSPGAGPTTLSVELDSLSPTADQSYQYTFAPPSGIAFGYDRRTGQRAVVKASRAIAPSAVGLTYTATGHQTFPCTLKDGSRSHMTLSRGRLTFSVFSFVSGTTAFGTITKQVRRATFLYDPGCGGTVHNSTICSGPEDLEVGRAGSPQEWAFEEAYGGKRPFEVAFAQSTLSPTESLSRSAATSVSPRDLPVPVAGPAGATATVKTNGSPLMSGTASFVSTTAPAVKTGTCTDDQGTRHAYAESVYAGTLSSKSPLLTVNFATGPLAFRSPSAARLFLFAYTS